MKTRPPPLESIPTAVTLDGVAVVLDEILASYETFPSTRPVEVRAHLPALFGSQTPERVKFSEVRVFQSGSSTPMATFHAGDRRELTLTTGLLYGEPTPGFAISLTSLPRRDVRLQLAVDLTVDGRALCVRSEPFQATASLD